jgi:hypothetical protein
MRAVVPVSPPVTEAAREEGDTKATVQSHPH